jgi:CMP-N,N'-diacetyllegionaminic acid synthase
MSKKNNKTKVIAIIPARGGSKGLLEKNTKMLFDKPLISYSIELACESQFIDKTVVSSNDKKTLEISKKYDIDVIKRPDNLSMDETPMEDVIRHSLQVMEKEKNYKADFVVLLQPTSPLRKLTTVNEAISSFLRVSSKYDSLIPIYHIENKIGTIIKGVYKPFYKPGIRRQELDMIYKECGTVFIFKRSIIKKGGLFGSKIYPFIIRDYKESIDIDSLDDFKKVETFMGEKNEN